MGLADLFRPRYRHSDVNVRSEAVRGLSVDDAVILTTIAKSDRDQSVRRIAIEKIETAEVLAEIAAAESDSGLRALARARAAERWRTVACGSDAEAAAHALSSIVKMGDQSTLVDIVARASHPAIKKRAMAELRDPRALAELAKSAAASEVRLDAISRIDDAEVLRALAVDVPQKEIALAAVEKIDDIPRLEQVVLKAKHKAVRQRARKIVLEMQEAEEAARPRIADDLKRQRAEKTQLVRDLEGLAETFDFAKVAPQIKAAEKAFAEVGGADADLDQRFQRSVTRFWQRKELADRQAEAGAGDRSGRRTEAKVERPGAERSERDFADRGKRESEPAVVAAPVDPAALAAAAAAREERELKRAEAAARAKVEAEARAAKAKEDAERGKQIAASLAAMVDEMEQLLAVDTSTLEGGRVLDRTLSQAQKAFEQLGRVPSDLRTALADRYGAVRGKVVVLVQDLREAEDWQRWANVPRAEALIGEAKAMIELETAAPDLAAKLKTLQARWKEIGALPPRRSKELWEQFKATCDQVYDRVKGVRVVEQAAFAEVAAIKERLIAEAEGLTESTDWQATAERLKALQTEWKASGHLPRKQGDELWKRFRAACDGFFERRKPLIEAQRTQELQNLAAKRALVARVTSIVSSTSADSDWGKAIRDVKEAQGQWKEIGFVPRADADPIYREFRAACDALFAKRDAARDAEANERRAALEAVSIEIDAVLALEDGADAAARASAVRAKVTELSADAGRPSIELAARLDRLVAHVITRHPEHVRGTPLDPAALRKRRETLLVRAGELLPKDGATVSAKPSDVAGALRVAMRQNAFSGLRFSGRDPAEVIEELRMEWAETGPLFDDSDREQRDRFEDVVARVLASVGVSSPSRSASSGDNSGEESGAGEGGRRRRERRGHHGDAAVQAPAVASLDHVTIAATVAASVVAHSAASAETPVRPASLSETPAEAPAAEVHDAAWDLDDHRPQAAVEEPSPPGAGELASDGAPEGDGIDTGWD